MQQDHDRLKIHTSVRPAQDVEEKQEIQEAELNAEEVVPQEERTVVGRREKRRRERRSSMDNGNQTTAGERLVRNTAVACALLLTAMSIKNVDHPWAQKATEGVRQAMTMRVDWDDTLGRLSFVRALVPETALVFLNLGQSDRLAAPVEGDVIHEYRDEQPWLEYRCEAGQAVSAAMSGRVTAVGQGLSGDWTILIEDSEGAEAVYGYLASVYVQVGQSIEKGQQIGAAQERADARLYFEWREDGEAIDPAERME